VQLLAVVTSLLRFANTLIRVFSAACKTVLQAVYLFNNHIILSSVFVSVL
jgi:hypothetical protein